jgi:hypothetical protein
VAFTLPWLTFPESGSLGVMVRARGMGTLMVGVRDQGSNPPVPLDSVTLGGEFTDSISTTLYSWTTKSGRPQSIELSTPTPVTPTDPLSTAEVDCVVPYLAP